MPVGYKGGKLQFEADNGLRTVPEHNPYVLKSLKGLKLHMNRRTGYDRDLGLEEWEADVPTRLQTANKQSFVSKGKVTETRKPLPTANGFHNKNAPALSRQDRLW